MQYNELQTPRVENWARRLLGIRNGGIVPSAAPELGVDVTLPTLEDVLPLAGYIRFGFTNYITAVAAQYPFVQIINSLPSQLVAVRWTVAVGAAQSVWLLTGAGVGGGALLSADNISWLDQRRNNTSIPLNASGLNITGGTNVNAPPTIGGANKAAGRLFLLASSPWTWPTIILPPATCCIVAADTPNTNLMASAECWMRDALPDEFTI